MYGVLAQAGSSHHGKYSRDRSQLSMRQLILLALFTVTCLFLTSTCMLFSFSSSALHAHEGSEDFLHMDGSPSFASSTSAARRRLSNYYRPHGKVLSPEQLEKQAAEDRARKVFRFQAARQELLAKNDIASSEVNVKLLDTFLSFLEEEYGDVSDMTFEQQQRLLLLREEEVVEEEEEEEEGEEGEEGGEATIQGTKKDKAGTQRVDDDPAAAEPGAEAEAAAEHAAESQALPPPPPQKKKSSSSKTREQPPHAPPPALFNPHDMDTPAPSSLEFLTNLLEQYRLEHMLWEQHKQRDQVEGDRYHMHVMEERIMKYQATPEVQEYARKLGDATQEGLRQRQSNCSRTLLCKLNKKCGFGCQFHHAIHCFTNAVATNRALILEVHPWSYSEHYEDYFNVVSECKKDDVPEGDKRVHHAFKRKSSEEDPPHVFLDIIDSEQTGFEPPFVPPDVMKHVRKFNARPDIWWIGQMSKFMLELVQPSIITYPQKPYTALHIRRTDKIGTEADFHALDEYMRMVKHQNVYVASDEPDLLNGAQEAFPNHTFYSNLEGADAAKNDRYTDTSLIGLLRDVFILANADYLVGTFSSQVSRLAFELAQTIQVDATFNAVSIDSGYYFGGWQAFVQCLTEDYEGYPQGLPIRYDLNRSPKTGYFNDKETGFDFPFHKTWECAPNYAALGISVNGEEPEQGPAQTPPPLSKPIVVAKKEEVGMQGGVTLPVVEKKKKGKGKKKKSTLPRRKRQKGK